MFKIIQKTIRTGIVTKAYPAELAHVSEHFRGRPHFDFEKWTDARPAAEVCPTGAISLRDSHDSREVTVDYGLCVFCGLCGEASSDKAVRITQEFELATKNRRNLVLTAEYTLNADHTHRQLGTVRPGSGNVETDVKIVGQKAHETIRKVLGRSLAIREVDAGSCNGCEVEIVALNNPIHDIERFGIQFVASPRHADMLLEYGAGLAEDVSSDARAEGSRRGRRLWHQRRYLPQELRVSGRRRQRLARRRLHSRLSTPAASSPPRNPACCRAARREAVSRARWVIQLSCHPKSFDDGICLKLWWTNHQGRQHSSSFFSLGDVPKAASLQLSYPLLFSPYWPRVNQLMLAG